MGFLNAGLVGDGSRDARVVTREHNRANALLLQMGNRLFSPGTKDIPDGKKTCKRLIRGYSQDGVACRLELDGSGLDFRGNLDKMLLDPVGTANPNVFSLHVSFDPATGKYKSLGRAGANGLLLDNEFSKFVERRWN